MTRHLILCGGLAPSHGENGRKLELTITDKPGGIDLHIEQLRRQMVSDINDTLTDLLDIAAYVYAADSQVSRGGRYMLIGWHYPAGGGKIKGAHTITVWDFYEAPKPWGPWTRVGSQTWSPQGYYCPCICPKFQSSDKVYVVTAGDWTNKDVYHITLVPLDLV